MLDKRKKTLLQVAILGLLALALAALVAPAVTKKLFRDEEAQRAASLAALNEAARQSEVRQLQHSPGLMPAEVLSWYRENNILSKPNVSLLGVYYADNKWRQSSLDLPQAEWAAALAGGTLTGDQVQEIVARFREANYAAISEIVAAGHLTITANARRICQSHDSGGALGVYGDTIYSVEDVDDLQAAIRNFAETSVGSQLDSSWFSYWQLGRPAGGWVPASDGSVVLDLTKIADTSYDIPASQLSVAIQQFPSGSSVRKTLDDSLVLDAKIVAEPESLLSPFFIRWENSSLANYLIGWAKACSVGEALSSSMTGALRDLAIVPSPRVSDDAMVVNIGAEEDAGFCVWRNQETVYEGPAGRQYFIRSDAFTFPNTPIRNVVIDVVRSAFIMDGVSLYAVSYRRSHAGAVEVRNSVSLGSSWRIGAPAISFYSIVGTGAGRGDEGASRWEADSPWKASSGEVRLDGTYFATRGVEVSPNNAYFWQIEAPFIATIAELADVLSKNLP